MMNVKILQKLSWMFAKYPMIELFLSRLLNTLLVVKIWSIPQWKLITHLSVMLIVDMIYCLVFRKKKKNSFLWRSQEWDHWCINCCGEAGKDKFTTRACKTEGCNKNGNNGQTTGSNMSLLRNNRFVQICHKINNIESCHQTSMPCNALQV